MGRFLNFLIVLSILLSAIVGFVAPSAYPLDAQPIVFFKYVNVYAGLVTLLVLESVKVIIINPFKPKFYEREFRFFSHGLKFDDSSRYFFRTTYELRKLPLLRPESIVFYFTLLILYAPQVSNSINLKFGGATIGLFTLVLIVVYCIYTWSVLAIDLMKQNQLTLLENTILSFMKEYDLYNQDKSMEYNLINFTRNVSNSYPINLNSVLEYTNENVYRLDEYKKTLAIAKEKLPEEFQAIE
ncbi:MAG: hypothetical protein NT021_04830 [Sphingobacteriales bacterium]|nr:hypothetical protein [Sphingobacteriales bacterium]